MLDKQFILENLDAVAKNIADRGMTVDLESFVALDKKRKEILLVLEEKRSQRNVGSKSKPTPEMIEQMKAIGAEIKTLEVDLANVDEKFLAVYQSIPNMSHPDSPIGGEDKGKEIEVVGTIPTFDFDAQTHEQWLTQKGYLDFERGAKVVGSKFYFSKGELVKMNLAILQLGIDIAEKHGFELVETPDLAKNQILEGIGFQPRGNETQIYSIENTDLSLVGTAEITMGGYHSNEVLDVVEKPKKYVALSHCYRTEAGAYGKTSKGLYRVHQFTKLEMFIFCNPKQSPELHQELLAIEKEICDALELSYHVIDIATGDLGSPASRKFDIEAYMHMKEGYGEVTSASNCTDYQSRRLKIKYTNEEGKKKFVHTLNGTAVVTSRMPIALIEQHQKADGSVYIPEKLRPYLGGRTHIN